MKNENVPALVINAGDIRYMQREGAKLSIYFRYVETPLELDDADDRLCAELAGHMKARTRCVVLS